MAVPTTELPALHHEFDALTLAGETTLNVSKGAIMDLVLRLRPVA